MTDERRIRKVKYDGLKVYIQYEVQRPNDSVDEYNMTCTDQPTAAFKEALNALASLVPEWADMQGVAVASLEIRGASFSWKHGIFGGCFTALRPLKNCAAPLVLNMPHKPSEPYSDGGDEGVCLTGLEHDLLIELCRQAEAYLDGERAQMELPLEDEPN